MSLRDDIHSLPTDRAPHAPGLPVIHFLRRAVHNADSGRLLSRWFAYMFVHMRTRGITILLALAFSLPAMAFSPFLLPSGTAGQANREQADPERAARELLLGAKDAISSGNIRFLRPHLGQKVYLNLFTGINGYYSGEQAFLILQSHFSTHLPVSFSFSSRNFSIRNPYGFGPLTYERRGRRESAEMFLSLANVRGEWVFNQITIATR
jgi:hypothetical protein